jgi:hypothetical protein
MIAAVGKHKVKSSGQGETKAHYPPQIPRSDDMIVETDGGVECRSNPVRGDIAFSATNYSTELSLL